MLYKHQASAGSPQLSSLCVREIAASEDLGGAVLEREGNGGELGGIWREGRQEVCWRGMEVGLMEHN